MEIAEGSERAAWKAMDTGRASPLKSFYVPSANCWNLCNVVRTKKDTRRWDVKMILFLFCLREIRR
jgi:hypothetical protein